jgi:PAS domain S-box-containing protein
MAPCGYMTTTPSGQIVRVNRTLLEWLGYSKDELLSGLRFVDLLTKGGRIFYETHIALLLRVENSVNEIAVDFICKKGGVMPALINARQKRSADNEPIFNHLTVFNASERRMYERQLLAARDLFETTLSSIGDGVISTDANAIITFVNPVAAALTGWDQDAAIGKPIEKLLVLLDETTGKPIENPIRGALRTGAVVGLTNHTLLLRKDGNVFVVDDSASPIRAENGSITGAVIVFRDVSERRKSEQALTEANKQLEQLAAELRRSNEDLSQFAYVASHDLRSPLNTVTSFIQLLERRYGDKLGEGKELLGHVTAATRRMATLIEDLLRFATTSSTKEHTSEPVNANTALATALENLRVAVDESKAVITSDPLPSLYVDQTSLVQLFQNLIANAIRYRSAQDPRIHIAAEEQEGRWRLSCTDNGIGIPKDSHERIFEPFKRLHGQELPGSGIGLAVCKKIVQRYGGTIWVESTPDEGSTFYFTIPFSSHPAQSA